MNVGYSFISIQHPFDNSLSYQMCKLKFPANKKSFLHRWDPPFEQYKQLLHCCPDQYFIQKKEGSSYINSLWSVQTSQDIISLLTSQQEISANHLKLNYAYNIFHMNLNTIFEARIISCFYKSHIRTNENIYWDLFIDHLNLHFYVSTNILKQLMQSTYNETILVFDFAKTKSRLKMLSNCHSDIFQPRKSTVFLTINKQTLLSNFKYENNVLVLQGPRLQSNNLVFDSEPLHIGIGITLTKQNPSFHKESNNNVMNFYKKRNKKVNRLVQCRMIIVCSKEALDNAVNYPSSSLHINFLSISQHNSNNESSTKTMSSQQHISNFSTDEYAILLIASNPKLSSDTTKYPLFDTKTIKSIQHTRNPNVKSKNGDKHNSSYGNYYGFGIINKYRILDGLSFGKFESKKRSDDELDKLIASNLNQQFSLIVQRLESTLNGCVTSGNDQINSLIKFGRMSTANESFITQTNSSNFMINNCFSMWVCQNARTEEFHQEVDSSYTTIGVPITTENQMKSAQSMYKFQYRWNPIDNLDSNGIDIGLHSGMSLLYNGLGLFHRQVPCSIEYTEKTFWNLSMYHNYRLFNSISKSINR